METQGAGSGLQEHTLVPTSVRDLQKEAHGPLHQIQLILQSKQCVCEAASEDARESSELEDNSR